MGKNMRSSVKLYEELLKLQNVKEGEKVVIVAEQQYARAHASIMDDNQTALANVCTAHCANGHLLCFCWSG